MESGVVHLAMEFTDEVRRLTNLVNLWRGEAKRNADTIDQLRKQLKEGTQLHEEVRRLRAVEQAYVELSKDRERAWKLLEGQVVIGQRWTEALCNRVSFLHQRLAYREQTIRDLGCPDWGHPIVP